MAGNRVCIICRKDKSIEQFNVEHIFPDTIGGALTIENVCKECNSRLGNNIDTPFIREPRIGFCRQLLRLNRSKSTRDIPNPFKKAVIEGEDVKKYYTSFENGQPKLNRISEHFKIAGDTGWQFTVRASPESLDKSVDDVLKKYGFERSQIMNASKIVKSITKRVTFAIDDTPIKLEGLKVAYELVSSTLPDYLDDEWSHKYAKFLETGKPQDFVFEKISHVENNKALFADDYEHLSKMPLELHAAFIKSYSELGLVCIVKFFNYFVFYLMSDKCVLGIGSEILFINDPLTRKCAVLNYPSNDN